MNILFLRGFNNYHKRTIIKYSTLTDYQSNSNSFVNYSGINFNNNDGIATELVVGSTSQLENNKPLKFDDLGSPDYCVVYETTTENDVVTTTIKSRWFILECEKIREGQYRLALKRDSIADHIEWLLNADMFIEKGIIRDDKSPFIFNKESMTYNQIKKKEIPLYDNTQVPWIVGYVAQKDAPSTILQNRENKVYSLEETSAIDIEDTPFSNYTENELQNGISYRSVTEIDLFPHIQTGLYGNTGSLSWTKNEVGRLQININNDNVSSVDNSRAVYFEYDWHYNLYSNIVGTLDIYSIEQIKQISPSIYSLTRLPASVQNVMSKWNDYNSYGNVDGVRMSSRILTLAKANTNYNYLGMSLLNYDGKQVKISDGNGGYNFYTISISTDNNIYIDSTDITNTVLPRGTKAVILDNLYGAVISEGGSGGTQVSYLKMNLGFLTFNVKLTASPATLTVKWDIPTATGPDSRWNCNNEIFDIFCIPYGDLKLKIDGTTIHTSKAAALACARGMGRELGSGLYDIQILPYCPIKEIRDSYTASVRATRLERRGPMHLPVLVETSPYISYTGAYSFSTSDNTLNGMYNLIRDSNDNIKNVIFWATSATDTFDIPVLSTDDSEYQYNDAQITSEYLKKKISAETEFIRLCSPNYNGMFEYIPAKNNNIVTGEMVTETVVELSLTVFHPDLHYINVDYTYRPYNPYIHLNPIFNGLYGKDWNDTRGLICGGDFSLGYNQDAFREYQIQNSNFQNIFDRQIQNLDVMNALQMEQTQVMSNVGLITDILSGGVSGAMTGFMASKGNGYAALGGAAVGATTGAAGGIVGKIYNEEWLRRSQSETRQYNIDMYNYQLGNIKALPYSISRTDCLVANRRDVPFLEVYQCKSEEIKNLLNIIKYDGMTVMTIDKLSNFIGEDSEDYNAIILRCHGKGCYFVKGRLIINPDIEFDDDFQVLNDLYGELSKGVYIEGTTPIIEEGE